ncbi:hypothetical protein ANDA3_3900 [plant metagenome]|uniref:Asparagine synthetase [glutamine-hydrolyzing] n=1 Tax=plant metagenome TaxID=1297885 RepID=A0A484T3U0_9ZZZZ
MPPFFYRNHNEGAKMTGYSLEDAAGFIVESSWTASLRRSRFSGIAYTDHAIIIGSEGYDAFSAENHHSLYEINEGRFCAIQYKDGMLLARTDALGQEILYYYHQDGVWAVSNSFLLLARHLRENGVTLTPDYDTLRLPFITHSVASQLVSNLTGFREIRVLPADRCLQVDLHAVPARVFLHPCGGLSNQGMVTRDDYEQSLIEFAIKAASRSRALITQFPQNSRFDITGGVDSRLVLSLLTATGLDLSTLNFQSNPQQSQDYAVAMQLGQEVGFQVKNQRVRLNHTTPANSYELWKLGNLGVYYPLYPAIGESPQHALQFHGACGECYRDFFKASAEAMAQHMTKSFPDNGLGPLFAKRLTQAVEEIGADVRAPDSMLEHYRHFRSRFHFGRSTFRNLSALLVTPLASSDLIHATRHLSTQQRSRSQLALDVLLLTRPVLASMPFDAPGKAFPPDAFADSPFRSGAPDLARELRDMKVYYSPASSPAAKSPGKEKFQDYLLLDLLEKFEAAYESRLFAPGHARQAANTLLRGQRQTMDAKQAVHMVTVGEIMALASGSQPAAQPQSARRSMQLRAWQLDDKVNVQAARTATEPMSKTEYAFYLESDDSREAVQWYTTDNQATFRIPEHRQAEPLHVHGFVREVGNPKNKLSQRVLVKRLH